MTSSVDRFLSRQWCRQELGCDACVRGHNLYGLNPKREDQSMDDVVNRLARELADAIAAAVADDPQVEACREKARAAGFEMRVTLEAVVGFVNRTNEKGGALAKVATTAKVVAA